MMKRHTHFNSSSILLIGLCKSLLSLCKGSVQILWERSNLGLARSRTLRGLRARGRLIFPLEAGERNRSACAGFGPEARRAFLNGLPLNRGGGHLRNSLGEAERDPTRNRSDLGTEAPALTTAAFSRDELWIRKAASGTLP